MKRENFAAFVMTYERPEILRNTITKLLEQTFPPQYILVVDNSSTITSREMLQEFSSKKVGYHRMGWNSGPAGAAKEGLEQLTTMGYQWVYWGDDDNPPPDNSVFERFLTGIGSLEEKGMKIGVYGGKGGKFNPVTGRIKTLTNKELKRAPHVEVDSIPGGHTMMINTDVVRAGIVPDEKLFFGFEEFDFCLRVKKKGFKLIINSTDWLEERYHAGNTADNYRWKGASFGKQELLWRCYYSTRNLLEIYFKNHYYTAFYLLLMKSIIKMIVGFRFGQTYGREMFNIQWSALRDFFKRDFYRLDPGKGKSPGQNT